MQANLEVGGRTYDEFDDMPFVHCVCRCKSRPQDQCPTCPCGAKVDACVDFERTTNPFWLDWADRREPKHTLEDEAAYDDALRLGEASSEFREWLLERRTTDLRLAAVDPFPV